LPGFSNTPAPHPGPQKTGKALGALRIFEFPGGAVQPAVAGGKREKQINTLSRFMQLKNQCMVYRLIDLLQKTFFQNQFFQHKVNFFPV
jgi:hypothetical protein